MDLLSGVKILHNLPMALLGTRRAVDQSGGTNLGISRREIGNKPGDQHLLVRIGERSPRRSRISAVNGNFLPGGRDTRGEFASKVEEETLGSAVLVRLLHAVFVGAHALEVGAGLGETHGE